MSFIKKNEKEKVTCVITRHVGKMMELLFFDAGNIALSERQIPFDLVLSILCKTFEILHEIQRKNRLKTKTNSCTRNETLYRERLLKGGKDFTFDKIEGRKS